MNSSGDFKKGFFIGLGAAVALVALGIVTGLLGRIL